MRDALLKELLALDGIVILTTHDYRLSAPESVHSVEVSREQQDVWELWGHMIADADVAWVVAPESSGVLSRLTELVESQDKRLIGCGSAAVNLASSKHATFEALTNAGIACVPTWRASDWVLQSHYGLQVPGWIAKPDDGVSCEGSIYERDSDELRSWLRNREYDYVVQPWREGEAASISMICRDGHGWLLSCNRQLVNLDGNKPQFEGCVINGLSHYWEFFSRLAESIAAAIPSLSGYIGVDLILTQKSPIHAEILEINPRLTTSYVGLGEATGVNIASLVKDLSETRDPSDFKLPPISRKTVDVTL